MNQRESYVLGLHCAPNHCYPSGNHISKSTLTCREQQFPPVLPALLAKHPWHHPATHNGEKGGIVVKDPYDLGLAGTLHPITLT